MQKVIQIERIIPKTIDVVWDALSDQDKLSKWFMPSEFKAEQGFEYSFTSPKGSFEGKVVEVNAPYKLVYTWMMKGSDIASRVSFELSKVEQGTKLVLIHDELENYGDKAAEMYKSFDEGWKMMLDSLVKYLSD